MVMGLEVWMTIFRQPPFDLIVGRQSRANDPGSNYDDQMSIFLTFSEDAILLMVLEYRLEKIVAVVFPVIASTNDPICAPIKSRL